MIGKAVAADNHKKGMLTAVAVSGALLLLGLTLSAILLFHRNSLLAVHEAATGR